MKLFLTLFFIFYYILAFNQNANKNGFVQFFYPNGKVSSEGLMINGKPDGIWKTYYVTGVLKSEGKRINHLLDSVWIFYSETADTLEKITYILGKKNGYYYKYSTEKLTNYTKTNVIISKELYINDKREGLSFYYYLNGKLKEIVNYKNNKKHGISKEFNQDSIVISINEYFNDFLTERQTINRKVNNIPIGIWREYYNNGTIKTEKEYKEGELNGYFKEYDSNGKLVNYQLYREGKIQQIPKNDTLDIEERITYFSNKNIKTRFYFKDNIPIGIHREYDENGNVINSMVYDNNGNLIGKGIIKDNGVREGTYFNLYEDGSIKSTGNYVNNRQQGIWQFYFKNKSIEQIGNFNNGYFNGEWKWFYNDSNLLRVENYINGKRNGLYFELGLNSDTIERGYYENDLKSGNWKIKTGDVIESGNFSNDLKNGKWKSWYSNGSLMYEGNYIDGNPDGKHLFYYDNGLLKEEQFYVSGIKEKTWKKYNLDGSLFITITYQNDTEMRVNGLKLAIYKK